MTRGVEPVHPLYQFVLVAGEVLVDLHPVRLVQDIDVGACIPGIEEELHQPFAGVGVDDAGQVLAVSLVEAQRQVIQLVVGDVAVEVDGVLQLLDRHPAPLEEDAVLLLAERQRLDQLLLVPGQTQLDAFSHKLLEAGAHQGAEVLAVAEHLDHLGGRGILVHLAEDGGEGVHHGFLPLEVQGADLAPGVAIDEIHGSHQTLLVATEREDIGGVGIELDHLPHPVAGRVRLQVQEDGELADLARPAQSQVGRAGILDREGAGEIATELMQVVDVQIRALVEQVHPGLGRQQAVEIGPGHQLADVAVIFERRPADDVGGFEGMLVEIPAGAIQAAVGYLYQAEIRLAEIRRNLEVDALHLARQALECGIELARQDADVFRVDGLADVVAPGELDEIAVALHQSLQQLGVGHLDVLDLPLLAVIKVVKALRTPAPVGYQLGHLLPAPVRGVIFLGMAQPVAHLQIEAATHQIEALHVADGLEVVGHLVQHQAVVVEAVVHPLVVLEPVATGHRQQPGVGILVGVGLHQHRLEHRLVGGVDSLVELPQGGAEILLGRNAIKAPQIEPVILAQLAVGKQAVDVVVVVIVIFGRHQIPEQPLAGDVHGAAVELVEQQQVLGAAAALPLHLGIVALTELVFGDQEEVEIDPPLLGPHGEVLALLFQQGEALARQTSHMTDPNVEIRVAALTDGGGAPHGVEALDGLVVGTETALAVGVLAEILDEGLLGLVGDKTPDTMRHIPCHITGQQGVIEVQHDRQQVENLLPVATHEIQRSLRLETIEFVVARHQRVEFNQQCPTYGEEK